MNAKPEPQAFLISLCGGLLIFNVSVFAFEEQSRFLPKEWSSYSLERFENTNCPKLEDFYGVRGQLITKENVDLTAKQPSDVSSYIADWYPRGADSDIPKMQSREKTPGVSEKVFLLRQRQDGFSVIRWMNNESVQVTEFSKARDDYLCSDGWIILAPIRKKGTTEGASYDVSSEVRLTRLANGGILYRQVMRSSRRDFLLFTKTSESVSYFFFSQLGTR